MKLAEALLLRRDLEAKLKALKQEILANSLIQEGDSLDISMEELIQDYQKTNEVKGENTYTISAYTSSEIFESEKVVRIMGTFKEYDNGRIMGETKRYIEFNTAELIEHQTEKIK